MINIFKNVPHRFLSFFSGVSRSTKLNPLKIVVCGAVGKIGQTLSLLLKQSPYIDELTLYDIKDTYSLGVELSHINTNCKIRALCGPNEINDALFGANIVAICVKQEQQSDDFEANADIITNLMFTISDICPEAFIGIVTNPLNSLLPVAFNVLKMKIPDYAPNRIFGVNSIDIVRANTMAARAFGLKSERIEVPVVGGHSKNTILPVFSRINPDLHQNSCKQLIKKVRDACEEDTNVEFKENSTVRSLAPSFAIARFISSLAMAIKMNKSIIDCAYVRSDVLPHVKYCSVPLQIGALGIEKNFGIPSLTEFEKVLFQKAVFFLKQDIDLGESYFLRSNKIKEEWKKYCPIENV